MANTSARILRLLSLLGRRIEWPGFDLADRLEVSARTLRRDIDTLRELGYPIESVKGPGGGYRLGSAGKLPPLVLDEEQAIAIALSLQTTPATVTGINDAVARALTTLQQVMPAKLRVASESLNVTNLHNYWDFTAPPIDIATLQIVGSAIHTTRTLRFDFAPPTDTPPEPDNARLLSPVEVEPHQLVVWAGRWYLIARHSQNGTWATYRIDRIRPKALAGRSFTPVALSQDDITRMVIQNPHRGDTPGQWPCIGTATLKLPASLVAQYAPGGSVVTPINRSSCKLTIGGWSWTGIAGLFITFDSDLTDVTPPELAKAFGKVKQRLEQFEAS